jgi:hypothetical protein
MTIKRITQAGLTNVRASKKWYFDADGNLDEAANNVLPTDHVPGVGTKLGFRVEGARTNSIRNPRAEGGTAGTIGSGGVSPTNWSSAGSLSNLAEDVDYGTEYGMPYIDYRLYGTPNATGFRGFNFETTTQIVAANGQTWTHSAFYRRVDGSNTNVTYRQRILYRNSGGSPLQIVASVMTLASSLARVPMTETATDASTARVNSQFNIEYTSGQALDVTVRIYLPQLEQGAFESSPILPPVSAPAASTRAADAPTFDISALRVYNPLGTTVVVEGRTSAGAAGNGNNEYLLTLFATSINYLRIQRRASNGTLHVQSNLDGIVSATPQTEPVPASTNIGLAFSARDNDCRLSYNGGAILAADVGVLARGLDSMRIGHFNSNNHWFGTIKSITVDGTKFATDAELQALSTLEEYA